jgi:hypothetical protein
MKKRRVAIFTGIYGGYETSLSNHDLPTQHHEYEFDFICYTDGQSNLVHGDRWRVIQHEPCRHLCVDSASHERLVVMHNTALLRSMPHKLKELSNYDICVYVDGNVCINDRNLLLSILDRERSKTKLILNRHPWRACVYQELDVCRYIHKYDNTDLTKQEAFYRNVENMPSTVGLFWNGLMIYIGLNDSQFLPFYESWSKELLNYVLDKDKAYHAQGQVSLPYALWKIGWLSSNGDTNGTVLKIIPTLATTPKLCAREHGH